MAVSSVIRNGLVSTVVALAGCGGGQSDTGATTPGGTGGVAGAGGSSAGASAAGNAGTGGGSAGKGGAAGATAGSGGMGGSGGAAGTGTAGSANAGAGGSAGTGAAGAGGSMSGPTMLALPQLIHGAAYVDATLAGTVPLVIAITGTMPDGVSVTFDKQTPIVATADTGRFVATVDAGALGVGDHAFKVSATTGGNEVATAQGSLTVASNSLQLTTFAQAGPAISSHVFHDTTGDRLGLSWVDERSGPHQAYLAWLDGAGKRLAPDDLVLSDPADNALQAETAIGADGIGVAYLVPAGVQWQVKLRVVGFDGTEKAKAVEVTQGQSAFHTVQAGVDPGGYSVSWLHITDGVKPVEARWARWDTAAAKLVGPVTLDAESPQPAGSNQGPLGFATQAEQGIACNASVCLVTYSKDVYNSLVLLNVPKIHLAVIDLATGTLEAPPAPVSADDWDTQEFGQQLIADDDGSFLLVYTANDTAAAVTPKSPCDESLERDLLFAVRIGADGALQGKPKPIFDFEGTREYPRLAKHPAGYALFWEDQRSECAANGHVGMAPNVMSPTFALLDPYLEDPGSRVLAPMYPSVTAAGTNVVHAWMDDRHGGGLADPKPELFLDTYWRK